MRRPRRGRKPKGGKHISLSATDAEWAVVHRNAERSGLSIARYLVGLVERDGEEEDPGPAAALSREEQRELLEAVRDIRRLMLEEAPPAGDGDRIAAPRRRPTPPGGRTVRMRQHRTRKTRPRAGCCEPGRDPARFSTPPARREALSRW